MIIDAHLHLWDLDVSEYSWLTPAHGSLYASWSPEQAAARLSVSGIDGAVLVQAEDSATDTRYLLDAAARCDWVLGVVGWVPLDDPPTAARMLADAPPALRGIRHLLADDPRADLLDRPEVRRTLSAVAARGLAFDVHDAWPRHLAQAERLAADLPELRIVIDHLGKPPRGRADLGDPRASHPDRRTEFGDWRATMAAVARHPNTVAKVSGLRTPDAPYSIDALRGVWDTALDLFGPSRLMYGGDWPITEPLGGYAPTWQVLSDLIEELSPDEQAEVLAGTAARAYALPSDIGRRAPGAARQRTDGSTSN